MPLILPEGYINHASIDDFGITKNGKLDPGLRIEKDPAMAEILNLGAEYLWVPKAFLREFKGLEEVIQELANLTQNVSKSEHELQLVQKVARQLANGNTNYESVKNKIMRSRPKSIEGLPGMFNFVRKFGGGEKMKLVDETVSYVRGIANTSRKVGQAEWDALSLDFKGSMQAPSIRHGVLSLLYGDPNGRLLKDSDIKRLGSKDVLPVTLAAQNEIDSVSSKIKLAADKFAAARAFGEFQAAAAAKVLSKKSAYIDAVIKKYKVDDLDGLGIGSLQWLVFQNDKASFFDLSFQNYIPAISASCSFYSA